MPTATIEFFLNCKEGLLMSAATPNLDVLETYTRERNGIKQFLAFLAAKGFRFAPLEKGEGVVDELIAEMLQLDIEQVKKERQVESMPV